MAKAKKAASKKKAVKKAAPKKKAVKKAAIKKKAAKKRTKLGGTPDGNPNRGGGGS